MGKYSLADIFTGEYPISQYYGANASYYAQFGLAGHEGVDWATPEGVDVLAPFDGMIIRDVDDPKSGAYGTHLVVWDPVQLCAVWYCHLIDNRVVVGDTVKKGQVLGRTGNTGNSTGPHLHVNFVETDQQGNRLHINNGFKGFLNILDANLVTWDLGSHAPISPEPSQPNISTPTLSEDEKRALDVLKSAFKTATTKDSQPFGNLEGFANTLTQDCYKAWKNPSVVTYTVEVPGPQETVTQIVKEPIEVPLTIAAIPTSRLISELIKRMLGA